MSPSGYLSLGGLTAMSWTLTGAAIILTAGRYMLRYQRMGRFFWDDAMHALALVTLVGMVATFTPLLPLVYLVDDYARGETGKPPSSQYLVFLKLQLAVSILFWVCVYAVKFSFLLLYRMLFAVSRTFNIAWWIVAAFTFLTFWACIAGELTACGSSRNLLHEAPCQSKAGVRNFIIVLEYSGVVHVLSDIAIMALPLYMLKRLQMPMSSKIGLASVFCLAIFVIIFDIIRTVISIRGGAVGAESALWDILEATVAVIVSCLPTYRTLFSPRKRGSSGKYTDLAHSEGFLKPRSIEMNTSPSRTDSVFGDEDRMKGAAAGHNVGEIPATTTSFADRSDSFGPPRAAHNIGVRQDFSVERISP